MVGGLGGGGRIGLDWIDGLAKGSIVLPQIESDSIPQFPAIPYHKLLCGAHILRMFNPRRLGLRRVRMRSNGVKNGNRSGRLRRLAHMAVSHFFAMGS